MKLTYSQILDFQKKKSHSLQLLYFSNTVASLNHFWGKTTWAEDGRKNVRTRCRWLEKLALGYHVTFRGAFLASGNSLSSNLTQRCMNCWTIGFSLLTIWKPVMLAPPCMTLSSKISVKPWEDIERKYKLWEVEYSLHAYRTAQHETISPSFGPLLSNEESLGYKLNPSGNMAQKMYTWWRKHILLHFSAWVFIWCSCHMHK